MLPLSSRIVRVPRAKYLPCRNRGKVIPKEPTTIGGHLRRRRVQLKLFQAQVAKRLGVSTRTVSLWECNRIYPAWDYQPRISVFLGFDPFTDPRLGGSKCNETLDVASLLPKSTASILARIEKTRIQMRKSRVQFSKELGIEAKTIWGWRTGRRSPSPLLRERLENFLESVSSGP